MLDRIVALSSEKKQADDKLSSFRVELDRELAARQQQEGELNQLHGELAKDRSELENGRSEFERKDSKLQTAFKALKATRQLAEERKADLEKAKSAFQEEKAGLELELHQVIPERDKAERQADEDAERLQRQVKAFKPLKYQAGYNDGRQGKEPPSTSRVPLLR